MIQFLSFEMMKYANIGTKICLLNLYNEMITNGCIYADWRKIFFIMIPKTRNLEEQFGFTNSEQVDIVLKLNINAAFATAPSFYIEIFS